MVGRNEEFNNPFQVADSIRLEMIRQAEETGRRALDWRLSSFDEIGGHNTLRRVWAKLKSNGKVGGRKRRGDDQELLDTDERPSSPKKSKVSSNVSSTCDRIASILLEGSASASSLSASSGDEVFLRQDVTSPRKYSAKPKQAPEVSGALMLIQGSTSVEPKQAIQPTGKTSVKPKQALNSRKPSAEPKQSTYCEKPSEEPKQPPSMVATNNYREVSAGSTLGVDSVQVSEQNSLFDQVLLSSETSSDSVPNLTSGTESHSDSSVGPSSQMSDSGNSEVQWGNPLSVELIGNGNVMQVMVGMSNTSDEDFALCEDESVTSNEVEDPLDDGIGLGRVDSVNGESDIDINGPNVIRYVDEIQILENGQNIYDRNQWDLGNGPEVSGGNRDGGARGQVFAPEVFNHSPHIEEELAVYGNVQGMEANGLEHKIQAEPNDLDGLGEMSGFCPK